ncbi:unnamed protein product, partial [Sphacelaria rigidula]
MLLRQEAVAAGGGSGAERGTGGRVESSMIMMTPRSHDPSAGSSGMARMEARGTSDEPIELTEADTLDRLERSLAQAQRLTLSVEARQTELLSRPKRRSHPSSKKENGGQSRKVRPKNGATSSITGNADRGSLKMEEWSTVKTEEPSSPVGDVGSATSSATASATADSEPELKKPKMKAKHRLLIKIPRSAVTAATAHAAEVAAAEKDAAKATSKANGTNGKPGSKTGGKTGS